MSDLSLLQRARSKWPILSILLCLVCFALYFWRPGSGGSKQADRAQRSFSWANLRPSVEAAKDRRIASLWSGRWERPKPEDFDDFLRASNHSPVSLYVAYMATRDPRFLQELKKHPSDKFACFVLSQYLASPLERLSWIQRLRKLDPNNGFTYLLSAQLLSEIGRDDEAAKELEKSCSAPAFAGYYDRVKSELGANLEHISETYHPQIILRYLDDGPTLTIQAAVDGAIKSIRKIEPSKKEVAVRSLVSTAGRVRTGRGCSIYEPIDGGIRVAEEDIWRLANSIKDPKNLVQSVGIASYEPTEESIRQRAASLMARKDRWFSMQQSEVDDAIEDMVESGSQDSVEK